MRGKRRVRLLPLGGMDTSFVPPDNAADLVEDMTYDRRGGWRESGGWAPIVPHDEEGDPFFAGASAVHSLHWWSARGGALQWLVFEVNLAGQLDLMYLEGSNQGTLRTIDSDRKEADGPWTGTQYLAVGNWLYVVNGGLDEPIRWNGRYKTRIGFDRGPGPLQVQHTPHYDGVTNGYQTGQNLAGSRGLGEQSDGTDPAPWVYSYVSTWEDDQGNQSPPSPAVLVAGYSGTTGKRYAALQVADAPDHARGIRLYRSLNLHGLARVGATAHYLLDRWGSGQGCVYCDGKPDAELGELLDETQLGPFPENARMLAVFKGTMFAALPGGIVAYSAPGRFGQWPPTNRFSLGDPDSGEITAWRATKNALATFSQRAVSLIRQASTGLFYPDTLTEDVGSAAVNAVVEVPPVSVGPDPHGGGLLFVSASGIRLLEGALENTGTVTGIRPVGGRRLARIWEREVNRGTLTRACAAPNHRDAEAWFQLPTGGDPRPSLGLVYHYETGEWSRRPGFPINAMAASSDRREQLFWGSWDTSNAAIGVNAYSRGYAAKGTGTVSPRWRSCWLAPVDPWQTWQPFFVRPLVVGIGASVALTWRQDYAPTFTVPTDTTKATDLADPGPGAPALPRWGTATWDATATWADYPDTPLVWSVGSLRSCRRFQFDIAGVDRMTIIGADLGVEVPSAVGDHQVIDPSINRATP